MGQPLYRWFAKLRMGHPPEDGCGNDLRAGGWSLWANLTHPWR